MPSIAGPQGNVVKHGSGGNQRIRQTSTVAFGVAPQQRAGGFTDLFIHGKAGHTGKQAAQILPFTPAGAAPELSHADRGQGYA